MDFKTNEGVMELFRSVNGIGNDNCFFVTFKNTNREGMKYGALGVVGGTLGAAASFATGVLDGIEGYDGLLINQTEKGLGIIPLKKNGMQLVLSPEKMEPEIESYVFVPNEQVEGIEIKNFNIFNKKTKKVNIKFKEKTLYQLAHVAEKGIPYQEANFAKIMQLYKNGKLQQTVSNTAEQQVQNIENQQTETTQETSIKREENLINNNQETEKFANQALNILMTNNFITDYNNISCEYGYLYKIEGHGYEGLFKIKKETNTFYFAVQGEELKMVKLDEQHFEAYKQSFLEMHKG